ncbi:MAG: cytochrome [Actinobacteria bacterium]|nr:cytochrome [Actinomycetota bacterium]|tara:strand:+ start:5374 stop:6567 length:1194 start_codon:yes stop_codon:yes gene_type:complete
MADMTIDLLDGEFYVDDPYTAYQWMRSECPVYWDATNELWGISRYEHVVEIEKNKKVFINSDKDKGGYRPNMPADQSIIGLDDPEHSVRRLLVSRRFTPRSVDSWIPHIEGAVHRLLDDATSEGRPIDIVGELAAPLPAMMIGHLLGFPNELWPALQRWSEETIALGGGPSYANDAGTTAVFEFVQACSDLYEEKRKSPRNDIMSAWVEAERNGLRDKADFGLDQIISDCLLLLDGGAETTRTVIARSLLELTKNPDQWDLLKNGANLDLAVEEFIRFVTPIHNMCRVATEDYEIGGEVIRKGQQIVLMYSSANRDTSHFDNPEKLNIARDPNHHIAFGFGTHFCLGASLARLEIKLFFEIFLERIASIKLLSEPVEMPNSFVYGLASCLMHLEKEI